MSFLLKLIFLYCLFQFVRSLLRPRPMRQYYQWTHNQTPPGAAPHPGAEGVKRDENVIDADYRVLNKRE